MRHSVAPAELALGYSTTSPWPGWAQPRCSPPSSAIICPVIAGAARMKRNAAAISSGLVPRRSGLFRQMAREALHQHEGAAQIDREMALPAVARRGRDRVVFENRRVINETADRSQDRHGARQQFGDCALVP